MTLVFGIAIQEGFLLEHLQDSRAELGDIGKASDSVESFSTEAIYEFISELANPFHSQRAAEPICARSELLPRFASSTLDIVNEGIRASELLLQRLDQRAELAHAKRGLC
jgi:hypothetical protein